MANRTGDLVEQVQEAHKLDVKALFDYASAHVPGFPLSSSDFTLSQVFLLNLYTHFFILLKNENLYAYFFILLKKKKI